MDNVERRLRELKDSVENLNGNILYAAADLKAAVLQSSSNSSSDFLIRSISSTAHGIRQDVFMLSIDLKGYFNNVHDDLVAIANRSETSTDLIKSTIAESNLRLEDSISDLSPADLIKSVAPTEQNVSPIAGMAGNVIPPSLIKKVELVLDAAAIFLKAWANPVNVGIALAIPIVAGVGILVFGVVKAIEALAEPLKNITAPLSGMGKLLGNLGSKPDVRVDHGAEIAQSIDQAAVMLSPALFSMDDSLTAINTNLGLVLQEVKKGPAVQQAAVVDFTPLINSIETAVDRFLFALPSQEPAKDQTKNATPSMTAFETEVLNLLSSPIQVSVQNAAPKNPEEDSRVFADAVTPLVSGQNAMYKMLDSNMRKLTAELQSLREAPKATDMYRMSKINDTLNTTLSDTTETLILQESQAIREVVTRFREEFSDFKTLWLTNLNGGEKKNKYSNEGPTNKSGN